MNVKLHVLFLILALLSVQHVFASDLGHCLSRAEARGHRLDREEAVRGCFVNMKSFLSRNECFSSVRKNRSAQASVSLNEDLKSLCFYETTSYKDVNECVRESRRFVSAGDRDEAVFYCYQIFQDKLSKKQCLQTAKSLIFAAKREHLSQHCLNSGD
jgi:hypothetical protein